MARSISAHHPVCAIIAMLGIALCGSACKTSSSSSGTDREAQEREAQEIERKNRILDSAEQLHKGAWKQFTARFKGNVRPGVGCDVCPDSCESVDLTPLEATAFQREYREAVKHFTTSGTDEDVLIGLHEHRRLLCMVRGDEPSHRALLQLLDGDEQPEVRYHAAVDAIQNRLANKADGQADGQAASQVARQVLNELAQGSDSTAQLARAIMDQWNTDGWPDETMRDK